MLCASGEILLSSTRVPSSPYLQFVSRQHHTTPNSNRQQQTRLRTWPLHGHSTCHKSNGEKCGPVGPSSCHLVMFGTRCAGGNRGSFSVVATHLGPQGRGAICPVLPALDFFSFCNLNLLPSASRISPMSSMVWGPPNQTSSTPGPPGLDRLLSSPHLVITLSSLHCGRGGGEGERRLKTPLHAPRTAQLVPHVLLLAN